MVNLDSLRLKEDNPRKVTEQKLDLLIDSLLSLPKMMELRPIVVNSSGESEAGNQRLKCLLVMSSWTEDELRGKVQSLELSDERKEISLSYFLPIVRSGQIPATWVRHAKDMTEEELREFAIKDNVPFGEWDWDMLQQNWNSEELTSWGVDVPSWLDSDESLDDFFDHKPRDAKPPKTIITLEYNEQDYTKVIAAFDAMSGSKEQIVFRLLKCDEQ